MDIFSTVTRWFGSMRSEMHHSLDKWAQTFPKQDKLGKSVTSKALSMTGLGFGLSPTTTHPEGCMLGFLNKHLPLNGTSVSSDCMISHSFPQVTAEDCQYPSQPECGPPPASFDSMAGQIPQGMVGKQAPLQEHYQQPCYVQKCQPSFEKAQPPPNPFYQPSHLGAAGTRPMGVQGGGFFNRPMGSYIGQSFKQAQRPEGSHIPAAMWTGVKGSNMPQAPMGFYGNAQQQINSQWSNVYPHSMQVPRPQGYQPNVMLPLVRQPCANVTANCTPQYYPTSSYPCNQAVYEDHAQVPQQRAFLPVGTPYVMCQSGSSPYMSIIPLQSVQVVLPAQIFTGSPECNPSPRKCAAAPVPRGQKEQHRSPVVVTAPQSQVQVPNTEEEEEHPTEDPVLEKDSLEQVDVKSKESDDNTKGVPEEESRNENIPETCSLLLTPTSLEQVEITVIPEVASSGTRQKEKEHLPSPVPGEESEPEKDLSNESAYRPQTQTKEERWREKLGDKTINLTPAPRKKKKSRPSAEKRRRRRTPTKCFLITKKESETQKETKTKKGNSEQGPASCLSKTVAFVLGLEGSDSKTSELPSNPPSFFERCSFSISPCDSDSDFDNFFDESSDSEKCEDAPDFDYFDFCSDPQNPLNCSSFSFSKPLKKSSSAPQLQYLAGSGPSSPLDESLTILETTTPKKRQVKFAQDDALVTVHIMDEDPEAYQEARKGHWELYALDRFRFRNRICEVENKISHIFSEEHRQAVYKKLQSLE